MKLKMSKKDKNEWVLQRSENGKIVFRTDKKEFRHLFEKTAPNTWKYKESK